MITQLTEWFQSLVSNTNTDEPLTDVKLSVGVLLYHIIIADKKQSQKELDRFNQLFTDRFKETDKSIGAFMDQLMRLEGTLGVHVSIIKQHLADTGQNYLSIMNTLNEMIMVDGIDDREYRVFEEIKIKFE